MAVRLVATDLDGTMLLDDGTVSPRVAAALAGVQAAGITVVLVSARNWRSVEIIASAAEISGLAICSNGAIVYDLAGRAVHRAEVNDLDVVRSFVRRGLDAVEGACVAWETALGAYRTAAYHALALDPGFHNAYLDAVEIVEAVEDHHEVTKLLVRHPSLAAEELLAELLPHADGLTLTTSGGPFVEVMRGGVTKAHALEVLCRDLGVSAGEVVAVGDQPNDLPMLRWAGRGVAMGNGHPSVLAADGLERTATNADDGLALVLEGLLRPS